jgi:hypothetical protein
MHGQTKNEAVFRPEYIDIICLVILLIIFFTALFLAHGVLFIVDILLLAGTAAVLGRTVGKMVKV